MSSPDQEAAGFSLALSEDVQQTRDWLHQFASEVMRPPMLAGPIDRHARPFKATASGGASWARTIVEETGTTRSRTRKPRGTSEATCFMIRQGSSRMQELRLPVVSEKVG